MTDPTITQTQYLTVTEVADRLRLCRMTVYRMIKDGTLTAIRTGSHRGTYRIPESSLAAHERTATAGPAPVPVIPGQTSIPHQPCECGQFRA